MQVNDQLPKDVEANLKKMTMDDTNKLIAPFQKGDVQAFEIILDIFRECVYSREINDRISRVDQKTIMHLREIYHNPCHALNIKEMSENMHEVYKIKMQEFVNHIIEMKLTPLLTSVINRSVIFLFGANTKDPAPSAKITQLFEDSVYGEKKFTKDVNLTEDENSRIMHNLNIMRSLYKTCNDIGKSSLMRDMVDIAIFDRAEVKMDVVDESAEKKSANVRAPAFPKEPVSSVPKAPELPPKISDSSNSLNIRDLFHVGFKNKRSLFDDFPPSNASVVPPPRSVQPMQLVSSELPPQRSNSSNSFEPSRAALPKQDLNADVSRLSQNAKPVDKVVVSPLSDVDQEEINRKLYHFVMTDPQGVIDVILNLEKNQLRIAINHILISFGKAEIRDWFRIEEGDLKEHLEKAFFDNPKFHDHFYKAINQLEFLQNALIQRFEKSDFKFQTATTLRQDFCYTHYNYIYLTNRAKINACLLQMRQDFPRLMEEVFGKYNDSNITLLEKWKLKSPDLFDRFFELIHANKRWDILFLNMHKYQKLKDVVILFKTLPPEFKQLSEIQLMELSTNKKESVVAIMLKMDRSDFFMWLEFLVKKTFTTPLNEIKRTCEEDLRWKSNRIKKENFEYILSLIPDNTKKIVEAINWYPAFANDLFNLWNTEIHQNRVNFLGSSSEQSNAQFAPTIVSKPKFIESLNLLFETSSDIVAEKILDLPPKDRQSSINKLLLCIGQKEIKNLEAIPRKQIIDFLIDLFKQYTAKDIYDFSEQTPLKYLLNELVESLYFPPITPSNKQRDFSESHYRDVYAANRIKIRARFMQMKMEEFRWFMQKIWTDIYNNQGTFEECVQIEKAWRLKDPKAIDAFFILIHENDIWNKFFEEMQQWGGRLEDVLSLFKTQPKILNR